MNHQRSHDIGFVPGLAADGTILTRCWCEGAEVRVPVADVRAGRTGSCHRRGCVDTRDREAS